MVSDPSSMTQSHQLHLITTAAADKQRQTVNQEFRQKAARHVISSTHVTLSLLSTELSAADSRCFVNGPDNQQNCRFIDRHHTWFLGSTQVYPQIDILIVFRHYCRAHECDQQTYRHTDHATPSVALSCANWAAH